MIIESLCQGKKEGERRDVAWQKNPEIKNWKTLRGGKEIHPGAVIEMEKKKVW